MALVDNTQTTDLAADLAPRRLSKFVRGVAHFYRRSPLGTVGIGIILFLTLLAVGRSICGSPRPAGAGCDGEVFEPWLGGEPAGRRQLRPGRSEPYPARRMALAGCGRHRLRGRHAGRRRTGAGQRLLRRQDRRDNAAVRGHPDGLPGHHPGAGAADRAGPLHEHPDRRHRGAFHPVWSASCPSEHAGTQGDPVRGGGPGHWRQRHTHHCEAHRPRLLCPVHRGGHRAGGRGDHHGERPGVPGAGHPAAHTHVGGDAVQRADQPAVRAVPGGHSRCLHHAGGVLVQRAGGLPPGRPGPPPCGAVSRAARGWGHCQLTPRTWHSWAEPSRRERKARRTTSGPAAARPR